MSVEYKIPSTVKHTLNAHKGTVYSVRYTSIGDYCISCGEDKLIQVFNPHAGTLVKTFEGHGKAIYDLCISKDSTKFASGGADRSVYLWDVEQGRNTKRFGGHSQRVNSVAFNEDASVLATGSYDAIVRLWDCRSNSHTPIQSLKNAKDSISSIEIFDKLIIAGSIDENIRIYDIRKGELTSDKMPAPVTNISLAKDCSFTCANTLDNKIRLIDFRDGTLLNTFEDIKNESYKLHGELNNLDSHFICGSENGDILIYDILKPKPVKTLKAHSRGVIWTACNPKSDQMVSCSVDGTIKVWE